MIERIDVRRPALLVRMHDEVEPEPPRGVVAELDHLANFHVVSTWSSGKGGRDG